eukprot:NODE_5856_length_958_cov_73.452695_g5272_i0.p1 GENE.NODE_5856_length_958_cov_73.452695_g5272_i0~~NODE_5856_length_958_cov_73.452695_g5272_i0.p1  ORF type:complete len:241 (-),score=26.23 NODE_5856_length_958_cov_73.452695_g5272_i0:234-890(-)
MVVQLVFCKRGKAGSKAFRKRINLHARQLSPLHNIERMANIANVRNIVPTAKINRTRIGRRRDVLNDRDASIAVSVLTDNTDSVLDSPNCGPNSPYNTHHELTFVTITTDGPCYSDADPSEKGSPTTHKSNQPLGTCLLCHNTPSAVVLMPCGHSVVCDECRLYVRHCPLSFCDAIVIDCIVLPKKLNCYYLFKKYVIELKKNYFPFLFPTVSIWELD